MSIQKWKEQFNRQIQATIKVAEKVQVEAAKVLLSNIERRTPIGRPELWKYPAPADYVPGQLRASWVMQIEGTGLQIKITIENGQPYAERVEKGWSTQAPSGMMVISCKEWSQIVDKIAKKYKI